MKVIGFNLIKILAERQKPIQNSTINTNIRFIDMEKENLDFLENVQSLKIKFEYSLNYYPQQTNEKQKKEENDKGEKLAELTFTGYILVSATKEEQKEFEKSWKKKQIPEEHIINLYNFILRKCSAKAILLQDEVGLPSPYLNFPRLSKN